MLIVDPDSLLGHYGFGTTTLTVNSANNTRLGFSVETFRFRENSDFIKVFDGPNINSPVLSPNGNGSFDVESTGSSITIQFNSFAQATSNPGFFRTRVRCLSKPGNFPIFQPINKNFASGNIQIADYDKDGDKDMLIGGEIFRNDSYFDSLYYFQRLESPLGKFTDVKMCSADFDNDGYKDIFITGNSNILGSFAPTAVIYHNNGNNTFSRVTTQSFVGVRAGGCSIVDFNNDGKPDICYTGSTNASNDNSYLIFKVYLNNGNMNFSDANVVLPGINGLLDASMSWADSDGDGDQDLVINGHNNTICISRLFIHNGLVLTNANAPLSNVSDGRIVWTDINKDGKPDIANCGVLSPGNMNGISPEILLNNGNNNFTRIVTNIPAWSNGTFDWADYDGDNDEDVIFCGYSSTFVLDAAVFKNNGNGQFSRVNIGGVKGQSLAKWVDFNKDGKYDLFLTGYQNDYGYMLKNMGSDSFKVSSFPMTNGVSLVDDFNNDGLIDVFAEYIGDVDCTNNVTNLNTLVIGKDWRLSGIPKFTKVANLNPLIPSPGNSFPKYWKWGDFNSDGKLDVIMTTDDRGPSPTGNLLMFKNNGNDNFNVAFNSDITPVPLIASYRQVGIFDIDNDGINEMFAPANKVYKWVNNQWQILYNDSALCGSVYYCQNEYIDFADYNNDGFMDAVVGQTSGIGIYKNNKAGKLVLQGAPNYANSNLRQVKWVDMDNDGDPDIVFSGGVLENRNGEFILVNSGIKKFIHTGIGDFNGDGFKDLFNMTDVIVVAPVHFYYNEQGSFFFYEQSTGDLVRATNAGWNNSAESFDMDNDGDDDLVHTAGSDCTYGAIVVNEYNLTNRLIHVVSPNGGENLSVNAVQPIKWYGSQVGNSVKIELSRDSGLTWQTITSNTSSTITGGSYQWNVTGPFSNKCLVKITDNNNVVYSDKSNEVFSISNNAPPIANAGRDTTICKGNSVAIGTTPIGNNVYSWTSNIGGFSSAIANPTVSPTQTTTYYLQVINGPFTSRDTVIVNVQSVNINLTDTLITACFNSSISIGALPQNGFNYSWTSTPQGFTSTLANPVVSPAVNTIYNLTQTNTLYGCQAKGYVKVILDSCIHGIINVYPNPANNYVIVQLSSTNSELKYFELIDAMGKVVIKKELTFRTIIDVRNIAAGFYYYTIKSGAGIQLKSGKLNIQH